MVITSGDTASTNPDFFTNTDTSPILLTVIIAVPVVGTIIILVIVIITIAIFFYIRSKRSNVLNVHGGGDSTYKKALGIDLTCLKSDKEGIVIHKEIKYRGSGLESKGGGSI